MLLKSLLIYVCLAAGLMSVPAAAQPAKEVLTVDLGGDVATLDPQLQADTDSYTVYRNIFDNMLTRNPAGQIVPQVAKSWKYKDDNTIDFQIQDGITFHDGSQLTAEDVAYSINRMIDPKFGSPSRTWYTSIAKAEVTGPMSVRVITKAPYAPLMAMLVNLSIVPKAYVEKVGNAKFNLEPLGSGPYRFVSWKKGVQIDVTAYDKYWRGKPPFPRVVFRAVPEATTRLANLQTGLSDVAGRFGPEEARAIKKSRDLKLLAIPSERIGWLFINAQWGPTADVRVRRAIAHAIDRQGLIDALLEGYGKPVNIDLTPVTFGYMADVPEIKYDPARAKALIKEAGAVGAKLTFPLSPRFDRRLAEAIQQMLVDVGLKVEIVMLDHPTFMRRRQGNPDEPGSLAIGRWSCACQDADGVIYPRYRSGSIWAKYKNPAFDDAVEAARATIKPEERLSHYKKAFEILREDVPGMGLFQEYAIYGARTELQWTPTPNEAFFIFDMKWKG